MVLLHLLQQKSQIKTLTISQQWHVGISITHNKNWIVLRRLGGILIHFTLRNFDRQVYFDKLLLSAK